MRLLIAILVASQLAGCFSYRASKVVAIAGGVMLVGGIIGTVTTAPEPKQSEHDLRLGDAHTIAGGFIFLGLVFGISGLIGVVAHSPSRR